MVSVTPSMYWPCSIGLLATPLTPLRITLFLPTSMPLILALLSCVTGVILMCVPSLTWSQMVTSRFGSFSKTTRSPGIPPLTENGIWNAAARAFSLS